MPSHVPRMEAREWGWMVPTSTAHGITISTDSAAYQSDHSYVIAKQELHCPCLEEPLPQTSCITVPSYHTVNLVKEPATHQLVTHRFRGRRKQPRTHFQNLNDNFIVVCNVYCFEHLAVLSPAQFPHDLVVVLIPVTRDKRGKCHLLASHSCTDSHTHKTNGR